MCKSIHLSGRVAIVLLLLFFPFLSMAQKSISGKVVSSRDQSPVPGVTVVVKGTKVGTFTNADGFFSISADKGDILIVSGIDIKEMEVVVTDAGSYTVIAELNPKAMNEVVVTALGIKKETKRLGYSVQEVKGS